MPQKTAVLAVDHDNFLVSERPNLAVYTELGKELGKEVPIAALTPYVGCGEVLRARLIHDFGFPYTPDELRRVRGERYREKLRRGEVEPIRRNVQFVRRFVEAAKSDFYIVLASMSGRDIFGYTLPAIGLPEEYFDLIVSGKELGAKEDKSIVFRHISERLGIPPQRCVVLEDSSHGVNYAMKSGWKVIAFPNEFTQGQEYSDADAVLRGEQIERFDAREIYRMAGL